MSSKNSKKNVPVAQPNNVITTRNKSAQLNRQLRAKNKKTETPTPQTNNKTVKSTKTPVNETSSKDTPLKAKMRNLVKLVEQIEYYPDKLKRDLNNKKILLIPKHNLKVVASANKRKMTVPQKGGLKSTPPIKRLRVNSMKSMKSSGCSDMSMADMVRIIEDNHSLSDEDFMEILTCPSPVWWEDPPDDGYVEDAICIRSADPYEISITKVENSKTREKEQYDNKITKPKNKKSKSAKPDKPTTKEAKLTDQPGTKDGKSILVEDRPKDVKSPCLPTAKEVKPTTQPTKIKETNQSTIQEDKLTNQPSKKGEISTCQLTTKKIKSTNQSIKKDVEQTCQSTTKDEKSTLIDFENEIEEFKISPKSDKYNVKKQALENILGNIKRGKEINKPTTNNDIDKQCDDRNRKVSISTDGEELSDLSFNEEEVLNNLENMDIPIEQTKEQNTLKSDKIKTDIKGAETDKKLPNENKLPMKTELVVPDILPPLTRKPNIKENTMKSDNSDSNSDFYLDNESQSNFRFISVDDISIVETSTGNDKIHVIDRSSMDESSSTVDIDTVDITKEFKIKKELINTNITDSNENKNGFFRKKVMNELSEYITVYKIMSQNEKSDSNTSTKSPENSSNNNVRGQLNSFFKKRKYCTTRLKSNDSSVPAIATTDDKIEKENSDDQKLENDENRLKPCDYCVVKTDNGMKNFSCEKCDEAPIFACDECNFLADTKEIYKNHLSSCKELARISWKSNLLTNQT